MRLFGLIDNTLDENDRPTFFGDIFDAPFYWVFPTLSRDPVMDGSFKERVAYNPTIASTFEAGVVKTRPRFTSLKKRWDVPYRWMTDADKVALDTLQSNVMVGSNKFFWPNQQNNTSYFVRLEEPIDFGLEVEEIDLWKFTLKLVEA